MISVAGGYFEGVQILLEGGADANEVYDSGETMLMLAAKSGLGDIVQVLERPGASVDVSAQDGSTALMSVCDSTSNMLQENPEYVKTLFRAGANPNAQK